MLVSCAPLSFNEPTMTNPNKPSRVGIGMTDGYRYVGIEPPLSAMEIIDLKQAGLLDESWTITHIDDMLPRATLLTVSGDFDNDHPDTRTAIAQKVAADIARRLGYLRDHGMSLNTTPVELWGYHSSPFNPNTDRR